MKTQFSDTTVIPSRTIKLLIPSSKHVSVRRFQITHHQIVRTPQRRMRNHQTTPDGECHEDIYPNAGQNNPSYRQADKRSYDEPVVDCEAEAHDGLLVVAGEVEEEPSEGDDEEGEDRERVVN